MKLEILFRYKINNGEQSSVQIENDTTVMSTLNQISGLQEENGRLKQQIEQLNATLNIFQTEYSFMKDWNQKLLDRNEELINQIAIPQQERVPQSNNGLAHVKEEVSSDDQIN